MPGIEPQYSIKPNAPCPCGSGKRFIKCHGKNGATSYTPPPEAPPNIVETELPKVAPSAEKPESAPTAPAFVLPEITPSVAELPAPALPDSLYNALEEALAKMNNTEPVETLAVKEESIVPEEREFKHDMTPHGPAYGELTYHVDTNGNAIIINQRSLSDNVEIPTRLSGHTVIGIAKEAFACCNCRTITIPDSVTMIGARAFMLCDKLTLVTIPSSVTVIGKDCFDSSPNIRIKCEKDSYAAKYAEKADVTLYAEPNTSFGIWAWLGVAAVVVVFASFIGMIVNIFNVQPLAVDDFAKVIGTASFAWYNWLGIIGIPIVAMIASGTLCSGIHNESKKMISYSVGFLVGCVIFYAFYVIHPAMKMLDFGLYKWLFLVGAPILAALACVYIVHRCEILHTEAWEYITTTFSVLLILGCIVGFIWGGLLPLQAHPDKQYTHISVVGKEIEKADKEVDELDSSDLENIYSAITENMDKFKAYEKNYPSTSFAGLFNYNADPLSMVLTFALCIGMLLLVIFLFVGELRKTAVFALIVLGLVVFNLYQPNAIRHSINAVSNLIAAKPIVNELSIKSRGTLGINDWYGTKHGATGEGFYMMSDGANYEGEFVAGSITGKGVYVDTDGISYTGNFVLGHLVGATTVHAPSGDVLFEGEFKGNDPVRAIYDKCNEFFAVEDYEPCYKIVSKLAEDGVPRATNFVGVMYENGFHVEQDTEKAIQYYTKAAELGEGRGNLNLGYMYYNGNNVDEDKEKGIEFWKRAAKQGNTRAQLIYAWILYEGEDLERNMKESLKWYEKAAIEEEDAMYELGMIYTFGLETKAKTDEGIALLKQAEHNDHERAKAFLRAFNSQDDMPSKFKKAVKKINEDKQAQSFEKLYTTMQLSDDASEEIIDVTVREFMNSTQGTLNSPVARYAEYTFLKAMTEYLAYEAPADEQNVFMLSVMINAGNNSTDLNRLMDLLREKKPEHIALTHYDEFKSLAGTFVHDKIIQSCIHRLAVTETIKTEYNSDVTDDVILVASEGEIPLLAKTLILSFGGREFLQYEAEMESFLNDVLSSNNSTNAGVPLSKLDEYKHSESIKPVIDGLIAFYQAFD